MSTSEENCNPNRTSSYFYKANKFFVINGLPSFTKWRQHSYTKTATYKCMRSVVTIASFVLVSLQLLALVTQKHLSPKQTFNQMIQCIAHPFFLIYYFVMEYHEDKVKELLYKLCITTKNVYNDPDVERQMIKTTTIYSAASMLNIIGALISYGCDGLFQVVRSVLAGIPGELCSALKSDSSDYFRTHLGPLIMSSLHNVAPAIIINGNFVPVITAWPDVTDTRPSANIYRVIGYLMWWIFMSRASSVLLLVILTTGCLSYQFKNLQSYFYSLNNIFDMKTLDGKEREKFEQKYENALKVGIQLHADTLWCTRQCQTVCSVVYSAQITVNVFVVSVLMLQLANSERSFSNTFTVLCTAGALLSNTGVLMWNAGDVTVEAALVPTAMYSSGWHHCQGKSSQRIRKLLVIAMFQAQRPVVIRSFGIMEVSYQACVTIVKASYSAFSIVY